MAYTPNYSETDLTSSITDGIVKIILTISSFITLIVVIAIFVWLKKKTR